MHLACPALSGRSHKTVRYSWVRGKQRRQHRPRKACLFGPAPIPRPVPPLIPTTARPHALVDRQATLRSNALKRPSGDFSCLDPARPHTSLAWRDYLQPALAQKQGRQVVELLGNDRSGLHHCPRSRSYRAAGLPLYCRQALSEALSCTPHGQSRSLDCRRGALLKLYRPIQLVGIPVPARRCRPKKCE